MKNKYVIESEGWNHAAKTLVAKKEKFNQMVKEMAVKYGVSVEEILKQLNN